MDERVVVVGAGPAGLATGAMLQRRGIDALVLESGPAIATAWRSRYESLALHTARSLSHLPGMRLPRRAGRYVPLAEFVAYLDRYAAASRVRVRTSCPVRRVERVGDGWSVATDDETITARDVVIATGYCRAPIVPEWDGRDGFAGEFMHSSLYRRPEPFRGRRVLVVGPGNSGTDIALDLAAGGAATVWLSARTPPQIVPRQALGVPTQLAGIALRRAPARIGDTAAALERRIFVGDLRQVGLDRPPEGLFTEHRRTGGLPILDHGFARALRRAAFRIVPGVVACDGERVLLEGGAAVRPDVVIAATGFRPELEPLVGPLGADTPGLHFCGFQNPISGALREIGSESRAIARSVSPG